MFGDRCSKYKRIKISTGACSTTAEEKREYVCASANAGQCKMTNTSVDMMSGFSGKRLSDEASCISTNASEHKRYRDWERYMGMTPEQCDAYLQRNREYKRRRKNDDGSMHKTTLASRSTGGTYWYFLKILSYLLT
jgi:hypothetical protein